MRKYIAAMPAAAVSLTMTACGYRFEPEDIHLSVTAEAIESQEGEKTVVL